MELIPLDEGLEASWDEFCTRAAGAWFWHRRAYREYTLAYRPQAHSRSLAFAVRDGGELVAAVPLMVEEHDDGPRFSFGGGPCWAPAVAPDLPPHRLERVLNEAFAHVDELAGTHGVRSVSWRLTPLANDWGSYLPFFLAATTRAGYADVSLTSSVIDVSRPIDEIRARMTKGHRSAITAAGRTGLSATVLTGADAGPSFDAYRSMHARAAGRVTRPAQTFELMKEWLVDEEAALVEAEYEGAPAGYAYLVLDAGRAYYGSAANEPEIGNLPVGQSLQNAALEWLNARGFELYEIGLQQFGELPYDLPSSKDLGLARFKRGFGGILRPLVTREKTFSVGPEDRA
ncbi:MAG: GNAT family N-acetyltransferase [Solirubrobacteraceae bacterium]